MLSKKNKRIVLLWVLLLLLCFLGVYFWLVLYFRSYSPFAKITSDLTHRTTYIQQHQAHSDPNPAIDYEHLSKNSADHLHVDSYTVKNINDMYTDSLLERNSYFSGKNVSFVNAYVGSHGIVSFCDPIISASSIYLPSYSRNIALNTGYGNSAWNLNKNYLVDYANRVRIRNIFNLYDSTTSDFDRNMWSVMKVNCGFLDYNIFANLNPTFYRITGSDYDYYDFLFLKNCAPNETVGLHYYNTNMIPGGPDFKKKKRDHFALKHEIPLTMTTGLLQDDDEGPKSYFLNGDYITELKKPRDPTDKMVTHFVSGSQFYNNKTNNVVYSVANSYFLQQMYQNYKTMSDNGKTSKLNDKYRLIDAYKKGLHLNPIIFNDFVQVNNKYDSPYLLNYQHNGQSVWMKLHPKSQAMLSYLECQDYNLPSNYDNDHYYYRLLEGTLVRDDNITYVNGDIKPLIMGDIHDNKVMPNSKKDQAYYATKMEYDFAKKYRNNYKDASQYLNYERSDGGLEPLWMIGLTKDKEIGTYHPGEIVRYNDKLSTKPISKYYIVQHGKHYYLPTYNVHGVTCFKATVVFKNKTRYFVRAQDAYMLMGNKIYHK